MTTGATSLVGDRRFGAFAATSAAALSLLIVGAAAPAAASGTANSVSVGLPPTSVAIDRAAHTAYVAVSDGLASQVAVVDTARCTALSSAHCGTDVAAVTLPDAAAPSALAYDPKSHTVYVADAGTGSVSMINTRTCNAGRAGGCAAAPKAAHLGLTAPGAVAVDTSPGSDAVYVADEGSHTVSVFNGSACNATRSTGCTTVRRVTVGSAPSAIAVDAAVGTVYVASRAGDSVSLLRESACSALQAACRRVAATVHLGPDATPSALVADRAVHTVFVADPGTNAVSLLNTARCRIGKLTGCSARPASVTGLAAPDGLALVSRGRLAVAAAGDDAVVVVRATTCNASTRAGCATRETDRLGGSPVGLAALGATVYAADSTTSSLDVVGAPRISATVLSRHARTRFGWYRSPIRVRFGCHAGTAPLSSACPPAVTLRANGRGQVVRGSVSSSDGGRATVVLRLNLDRTKPTVAVAGVTNGKTYSSPPTLRCVAHDRLSGVASCAIARTHHGRLVHYVATARDKAGNIRRIAGRYRVS